MRESSNKKLKGKKGIRGDICITGRERREKDYLTRREVSRKSEGKLSDKELDAVI